MIQALRYESNRQKEWDGFVAKSKNANFLFFRGYMDYHSDRFKDHSLLFTENGDLVAVLPAHAKDERLMSHNGLSFGGVLSDNTMTTPRMLEVFEALLAYLKKEKFDSLFYKTIPYIYHSHPAEEDRYALFLKGAVLVRRDLLSVIRLADRLELQERRQRAIKKAEKLSIRVGQSSDFKAFWPILEENLKEHHGLAPVHSLSEIQKLHTHFPETIRLYTAEAHDQILAGAVVYLSATVAHMQYNAASPEGRASGALDVVCETLIRQFSKEKLYFDFGVSTEEGGRRLNVGLVEQKEGFGARAVTQDFYEITV